MQAIFVLGSPRSGTSVLGAYIGSHPEITALGEYLGFHFAGQVAPELFPRELQPHQKRYLAELVDHSVDLVTRAVGEEGTRGFCDDSPWNAEIVPHLESLFPTALYLLCLRHYKGVIQSLRRSYADGRAWVGATDTARAETWARFYCNVADLPAERTIPVSFEKFCAAPRETVTRLGDRLNRYGFPRELLDPSVLVTAHAAGADPNLPTVASLSDGMVVFGERPSFDPDAWTDADEEAVQPMVLATDALLRERYPGEYTNPGVSIQ